MKNPIKVKQGKKAKASGAEFERRVRKDLEEKGWIVAKWSNNIEFNSHKEKKPTAGVGLVPATDAFGSSRFDSSICGKIIPAKHKFRGNGIPMAIGTGFPDFICFKRKNIKPSKIFQIQILKEHIDEMELYNIIGVEVKTNGILSKLEKEKCEWYIKNDVFSKILIAEKTKIKNKIVIKYHDFEEKYNVKI
jgi:hypothetical protein